MLYKITFLAALTAVASISSPAKAASQYRALQSRTGFCMTVDDTNTSTRQPVKLQACQGNPNQLWYLDGSGYLHPRSAPASCLEAGTYPSSGTRAYVTQCAYRSYQQWSLQSSDETLHNQAVTDQVLDHYTGTSDVGVGAMNSGVNQRWYWGANEDDYRLVKATMGRIINYPIEKTDSEFELKIKIEAARHAVNDSHPAQAPFLVPRNVSQFPGDVPALARPVERSFVFDRNFPDAEHLRVLAPAQNWMSTGLYAKANLPVSIFVTGATEQQLNDMYVRINVHTDKLARVDPAGRVTPSANARNKLQRFAEVSKRVKLMPGANWIRSQYGGLIVLESGSSANVRVSVRIQGAFAAPYFKLGETSLTDWNQIRQNPAPWGELEGNRVVVTVPSATLRTLDDPARLLREYDVVVWRHEKLAGLDANDPNPKHRPQTGKHRFVEDIQITYGGAHGRFPMMFTSAHFNPQPPGLFKLAAPDAARTNWGVWHELGHNYQQQHYWAFTYGSESTVNLFSGYAEMGFIMYNRPQRLIKESRYSKAIAHLNDATVLDKWGTAKVKEHIVWNKLVFLMQILHAFPNPGWNMFAQLQRQYRELSDAEASMLLKGEQERYDKFFILMSKITGHDLTEHFDKWTVPVSPAAKQTVRDMRLPRPSVAPWTINPE